MTDGPVIGGDDAQASPLPTKQRFRWRRVALLSLVVVVAVFIGAVAYSAVRLNNSVSSIPRDPSAMPSGSRPPSATTSQNAKYQPMNILLLGSDTRGKDNGNSDTMIVLHLTADRKAAYLVSFPRDMWVTVPGLGQARINAAYSTGGTPRAVETLEKLTGARIDHTVVTDFSGFVGLVDTVGPVTVDNPVGSTKIEPDAKGVSYDFRKTGPLTLTSGDMALAYVRERMNLPRSDFDRTLRQRAFLRAIALKVMTPDVLANPGKLNDVITSISQYLTLDAQMSNTEIYSLAASMTGITSSDQIHLIMAPIAGPQTINGADVERYDVAGVAALGKALQNDTMAEYVAAYPSVESGGPTTSASPPAKPSTPAKPSSKPTATKSTR